MFISAVEFGTDDGEVINLLNYSPVKVKKRLQEVAEKWCIRKGLKACGCTDEEVVNKVELKWAEEALHRMPLSKEERGGLRATTDGSAWTEARMFEAGYLLSGECPCHDDIGSTPHRLLWCNLHQDEREKMLKGALGAAREQEQDEWMRLRVSRIIPIRAMEKEAPPKDGVVVPVAALRGQGVQRLEEEFMEETKQQAAKLEIENEEVPLWEFDPELIETCRLWR